MKNALVILLFFTSSSVFGQNKFNQWTLSAGASYSVFRGIHKLPFHDYEKQFKFTVGGQFHADYGLFKVASVGVGITHQRHHLTIKDYTYTHQGQNFTENPVQSIHSSGFYGRFLIHVRSISENTDGMLDYYWGGQQHFIYLQSYTTSSDPNFHKLNDRFEAIPGFVTGIRFYPLEILGIHAELGVPGNYNFSLGLVYRTP